ncbi:acyltransferase [Siphonobacter sp. SORGH_AS_0500]|uniref:acyltransferase family protein n=1 Tax=Siphonobacter sp. SORGH_AS_0500 TaxID=1864824 RepID=UPI002865BFD5|nr:acyltransferase [Siphonobacter sp. SORGH_AS_0500]MDR6196407.1 peptidoglycan/LPS O-acetylase OafA/YrhL [Siphonobacter sp. SORGH_AS_0500]
MLQSPLLFIFYALLTAITTAWIIQRWFPSSQESGRYQSIDGLRGYLAFSVFLHHTYCWRVYLQKGQWQIPESRLFAGLGAHSVMLFFMITGFLFFSKLKDSKKQSINWFHFYRGRLLRLGPVYLLAISFLFLLVAFLSQGELHDSFFSVTTQCLNWVLFTLYEAPYINQVHDTLLILAGVTWTLVYEWLFYSMLPLIGFLFFKVNVPRIVLILATGLSISIAATHYVDYVLIAAFLMGLPAVYLVKKSEFKLFARSKLATLIILGCYGAAISLRNPNPLTTLLLLSIVFTLIALGNDIFGLLTRSFSLFLGQCTYVIYLFHGFFIYVVFKFLLGFDKTKHLSDTAYGLVIVSCVLPLLILCSCIHHFIELPSIRLHKKQNMMTRKKRLNISTLLKINRTLTKKYN